MKPMTDDELRAWEVQQTGLPAEEIAALLAQPDGLARLRSLIIEKRAERRRRRREVRVRGYVWQE